MSENLVLIFDTETTGLFPKNNKNKQEYPFIVQLSFIVFDLNKKEIVFKYNEYIKQRSSDNINYDSEAFKITKITKQMCDNGVSIIEALNAFYTYYMNVQYVVAHNLDFDREMIQLEIIRNFESFKMEKFTDIWVLFNEAFNKMWGIKTCCTMHIGKFECKLSNKNGFGYKMPKLVELHNHLFGKTPSNLHDSLTDCYVCLKCFIKMKFNFDVNEDEIELQYVV